VVLSSARSFIMFELFQTLEAPVAAWSATKSPEAARFRGLQSRSRVLAAFADLNAVAGFLRSKSGDVDTKDAVVLALAVEYQQTRHPVWGQVLLAGFNRSLANIHRQDSKQHIMLDEDLAHTIVHAFLQVALRLQPQYAGITLHVLVRDTNRTVFETLEREARHRHVRLHRVSEDTLDEHARLAYGAPPEALDPRERGNDTALRMEALLEAAHTCLSGKAVAHLRASAVSGETLKDRVYRMTPGDEAAKRRAYQRIKRQQHRAKAALRARVAVAA
jgi:hypothetical protein